MDGSVAAAQGGSEPEGLPDQESLGLLVRRAHRAFVRALAAELAPYGISNAEWSALRVLWRLPGPTQVELAEELAVEKASVTPVLAALERKHLVIRDRDTQDRRKTRLHLTARGRDLEGALLPLGAKVNARAAAGLGATQRAALRAMLHRRVDQLPP